jgi:DNA ligase D-like protein (predicted 3'-phosphoesterase)
MGLKPYRDKRRFNQTPEPAGSEVPPAPSAEDPIFVIQKHQATHLHWDLRLEDGGLQKSWAVPKEPPTEPGIRRLAMEVEDHPLEYAKFEGLIPEGDYGAGRVEIWDRGTYRALETTPDKRVFELRGGRLAGPYALVRLKPKDEKGRPWLFFKLKPKS